MTDIFDLATKQEEQDRAEAIERQRLGRELATVRHQQVVEALGHAIAECVTCGMDISPERRQAVPDCTRCAECQRAAEVRNKNMNR